MNELATQTRPRRYLWLRKGLWLALRSAILLAAVFGILYFIYNGISQTYTFRWERAWGFHPRLLQGFWITIQISLISIVLSVFLGLVIALGRLSRWGIVRDLSGTYVHTFRNLPFLVVALLFFFGLGQAFKIPSIEILGATYPPVFIWGVLALSFYEASYLAEIFRAGIESVNKTQGEAAQSLGMNSFQVMRYIIMPQALKVIIPPMTSTLIALIKESALLSIIGVQEMTYASRQLIVPIVRPWFFEFYTMLAAGYLLLVVPLSLLSQFLEKRLGVSKAMRRGV